MKTSKGSMYTIENGKPFPVKAGEMEWLLRYGRPEDILEHRLYIAHIVSLYISLSKDSGHTTKIKHS